MNDIVMVLIGAAWVAIFVVLVWGVVDGWRRQLRNDEVSP
jgi:hypothetical protein